MDLLTPVQYVKGIGPQRARSLEALGLRSAEDLLLHVPLRYEDRRAFTPIAALQPGTTSSVTGRVAVAGLRRARRMTLYEIRLEDESGRLKVIWFNQAFLKGVLPLGTRVALYGTLEMDRAGGRQLTMLSPQYEVLGEDEPAGQGLHTGRIVPIYEKLGPLQGKLLRRTIVALAEQVPADLADPLPEPVRRQLAVLGRGEALRRLHVPEEADSLETLNAARSAAHLRLILEELFLFQLGLAQLRAGRARQVKGIAFTITDKTREAVKRVLPFPLTAAQKRVLREIADDMRAPHPMSRLLQGDVGSGKTVVALLAMLIALDNGFQVAFMAPTEILAEQHGLTLKRLLRRVPYQVELVTAGRPGRERRAALERLASGETQIAVGTHALIQSGVHFAKLGLAVVDEQHRFGVLQREELRRKGFDVDLLVMTATPIPRSLALTAYGDLDTSVIDERPPGRTPVKTRLRPASERRAVLEILRRELRAGRQAYVIYPLVEESEKLEEIRAATEMSGEWAAALPGSVVALLHGRMKAAEKERVMQAFAAGQVHALVATTVVEVGVDVPNASVMVIEHAERFGLAQLHQLRGRVGRGAASSLCILLAHGRLSAEARARLQALVACDDGFEIAEKDLELRGPGDFFGTRQSGLPTFRVAHLVRDRDLLETARREAFAWAAQGTSAPGPLRAFLEDGGWERRFGLARVG